MELTSLVVRRGYRTPPDARNSASRSTTLPSWMTVAMRNVLLMSSRGSASSRTMSAIFPSSIVQEGCRAPSNFIKENGFCHASPRRPLRLRRRSAGTVASPLTGRPHHIHIRSSSSSTTRLGAASTSTMASPVTSSSVDTGSISILQALNSYVPLGTPTLASPRSSVSAR